MHSTKKTLLCLSKFSRITQYVCNSRTRRLHHGCSQLGGGASQLCAVDERMTHETPGPVMTQTRWMVLLHPSLKNLEPDNSCESRFCRDQREKKPVQICSEALRKRKWELFAVTLRLAGTVLQRNDTTTRILTRIGHHCCTFCPTSHTSSSLLSFTKKFRKSQVIIHALIHAFSAVAVMQSQRFAQSVSVLYRHLLVKYDHYCSGARLLPYPSFKGS